MPFSLFVQQISEKGIEDKDNMKLKTIVKISDKRGKGNTGIIIGADAL